MFYVASGSRDRTVKIWEPLISGDCKSRVVASSHILCSVEYTVNSVTSVHGIFRFVFVPRTRLVGARSTAATECEYLVRRVGVGRQVNQGF